MHRAMRSVHCPMCGYLEDHMVDLDSLDDNYTFACPTEGCEFRVMPEVGFPSISGIQSASPEVSKQLGKTFYSSAEKKAYMKEHKLVEFHKGDAEDISRRDHARERADIMAKRMGHRDEANRRETLTKEKAKGWTPTPGDGKLKDATR